MWHAPRMKSHLHFSFASWRTFPITHGVDCKNPGIECEKTPPFKYSVLTPCLLYWIDLSD